VTWEIHPAGDEIGVLSGNVTMVLDRNGIEEIICLREVCLFAIGFRDYCVTMEHQPRNASQRD
jgi:hypothetical protein